ncbi:MAG: ABC transporter substrate-binding protein [Lautropia sp.]
MRNRWIAALAAVGLSLTAPVLAQSPNQSGDWDQVIAAAKREGTVVVYSGSVGVPDNVAVMKAFEAKYGIKVELLEARAAELRERLRTELSLNRPSADVIYNSVSMLEDNRREGSLQPFGRLPLQDRLLPQFTTDGSVLPVMVLTYGLLINTQMVPEAEAPKSWKDLLEPKWKGRMLMDDPRTPGGASLFFTVALNKLGQPFLEGLAQQQPTMSRENRQAGMRVARGEFPIYFALSMADGVKLKGLPVKAYFPEEGAPYLLFGLGMVRGAAHPNAARLLINHFLERESARPFHLNGRAVTYQADPGNLDPFLLPYINAKLMGTQARSAEHIDLAKSLFK